MAALSLWLAVLALGLARAASPAELALEAEARRARAEVGGELTLLAYDLLDELVLGWAESPPFPSSTPVVLAQVNAPVGMGSGLSARLENHLGAALLAHPRTNLRLVHCPACTAFVFHSGPEGTVIGRGVDDPALLARLAGEGERHALFLDLEAEGTTLVLRARLTRLEPELPIAWSRTLSTATGIPALLRDPTSLKSAEQARREYLDVLRGRDRIDVPIRLTARTYRRPASGEGTGPPPFLWLQSGVELAPSPTRAWTGSLLVGYTFLPEAYQGLMAQGRIQRLLSGRARSTTRPDLYAFFGVAAIHVWGDAVSSFQEEALSSDDLLLLLEEDRDARRSFGALHGGLDLRLGPHLGLSGFLELMPEYSRSENLGAYIRLGNIRMQAFGVEVTACL